MPELAEVESARRHLDKMLKGDKISEIVVDASDKILYAFADPHLVKKALKGAKVIGTGRKGKYFWLQLDKKPWPIFHLGMTGRLDILLGKNRKIPKVFSHALSVKGIKEASEPNRLWFCRFLFRTADKTEVAFIDPRRFGRIWLADDPEQHPRIKKLGFDPLVNFPPAKELHNLITKRRIAIKAILLDQAIFAGVGNYLADEILFQSKISPHRPGTAFTLKDVQVLRKHILSVIKKAVELDANYELFPKTWLFHNRWGKSKKAKISRGDQIVHDEIGGRTTAWVPTIQK